MDEEVMADEKEKGETDRSCEIAPHKWLKHNEGEKDICILSGF